MRFPGFLCISYAHLRISIFRLTRHFFQLFNGSTVHYHFSKSANAIIFMLSHFLEPIWCFHLCYHFWCFFCYNFHPFIFYWKRDTLNNYWDRFTFNTYFTVYRILHLRREHFVQFFHDNVFINFPGTVESVTSFGCILSLLCISGDGAKIIRILRILQENLIKDGVIKQICRIREMHITWSSLRICQKCFSVHGESAKIKLAPMENTPRVFFHILVILLST